MWLFVVLAAEEKEARAHADETDDNHEGYKGHGHAIRDQRLRNSITRIPHMAARNTTARTMNRLRATLFS